jgi:hypothetical protein
MSFVTAAMLYSSRSALDSASIRAVFPEPTGLQDVSSSGRCPQAQGIPANANGEAALLPVAALDQRQFALQIRAGAVEDLVRVAVVTHGVVGVAEAVFVGVRVGHCSCRLESECLE